jgi:hypothetical protein
VLTLIATLAVAILCLFRDESLLSFLKKVGGTYVFFSVLSSIFSYLWRIASYRPPGKRKGGATSEGE